MPFASSPHPTTAADRAFARYCRTLDPDALAEVFDRTAPQLAVLAGHLVPGDSHAVEDLVQTTFLEAMRSAARFEPGRPVLPWLVTILGRRAANLHRHRRGPNAAIPPDLADLVAGAPDPAKLAADRELASIVATAIDALAAPYREVMALRLIHSLSPIEIARALGRPLGTVHSQLHRGGSHLRRQLPATLAAAVLDASAPPLAPPRVAAIRVRLVEAATRHAATITTATTTSTYFLGALVMSKLAILAILSIAAAAALLLWPTLTATPPPPPSATAIATDPMAMHAAASAHPAVATTTPLPTPSRRPLAVRAPAIPPITLTGRTVTADTEQPLAGVEITARYVPGTPDQQRPRDPPPPAATFTTDHDGRYHLELPPDPGPLSVLVRAPGRATVCAYFSDPLRPGAVIDSGDVPLPLGAELSLRALDESDTPVQSFSIQLRGLDHVEDQPRSTDGQFRPLGWGGIQTAGPDGVLGPRSIPAGTYEVQFAEGTGHRYGGPDRIEVPAGRTSVRIDLPVREPDLSDGISGTVVDQHGQPVPGVEVAACQRGSWGTPTETTFNGGRFFLPRFAPERGPIRLLRVGRGAGDLGIDYEIVSPRDPIAIGSTDVQVVVRRRSRLAASFRIVAARTRRPVERFRVRWQAVRHVDGVTRTDVSRLGSSLRLSPPKPYPHGSLHLDDLLPCDYLLTIAPDDPALQPVVFHEFHPADSETMVEDVPVQPAAHWHVLVVDAESHPVVGSTVELLRGYGRTPVTRDTPLLDWSTAFDRGQGATYFAIVTASAKTDASGLATLRTAPDVTKCALRVRGASHLEAFLPLAGTVTEGETRKVVVQPAGRITGRLGPMDLMQELGPTAAERAAARAYADPDRVLDDARLELWLDGRGGQRHESVGDDGRFSFEALPPGDYVLLADPPRVDGDVELAKIDALAAGETREVSIDLRPYRPATVRGHVLLDDAPPPVGSTLSLGDVSLALDADGGFEAQMPPGSVRCRLDADGVGRFARADSLDLPAGATVEVTLAFVSRRMHFLVRDHDGTPVAGAWIRLSHLTDEGSPGGFGGLVRLDEHGEARLAGAWLEPMQAELWLSAPVGPTAETDSAPRLDLGVVAVPPGQREGSATFDVDVAAARRR